MDMELQSWTRGCKQVHEIKQNKFCIECFTADFLRKRQNSTFGCPAFQ